MPIDEKKDWHTLERVSLYPRLLPKHKQLNLKDNKSSCAAKQRKTRLFEFVLVKLQVLVYPQGHGGIEPIQDKEVWYTLEGVSLNPRLTREDKQLNNFFR